VDAGAEGALDVIATVLQLILVAVALRPARTAKETDRGATV
jgi:hypothetical protein